MTDIFTVEEANLIDVFGKNSRNAVIAEITAVMPDLKENEPELTEIAENVIAKLSKMSDEDFDALELYPEYDDIKEE